jgi:putative hydrolase of the HAD superfamily
VPVRAITLDLDDTLWPFAPVAGRIDAALTAWMAEHAPLTASRYGAAGARAALIAVRSERPDLAHLLSELRRESLRRVLADSGEDPALADAAVEAIMEARQQVDLYPDAAAALDLLSSRVPLLALTNGNADLARTGVARWFGGIVSATETGFGKPDARIFHLACERLRLPPCEVLHVGDNLLLDVRGALDAGMQAAWVHRDFEGEAPPGALRFRDLAALADSDLLAA